MTKKRRRHTPERIIGQVECHLGHRAARAVTTAAQPGERRVEPLGEPTQIRGLHQPHHPTQDTNPTAFPVTLRAADSLEVFTAKPLPILEFEDEFDDSIFPGQDGFRERHHEALRKIRASRSCPARLLNDVPHGAEF